MSSSSEKATNQISTSATPQLSDSLRNHINDKSVGELVKEAQQKMRCVLTSISGFEVPEEDEQQGFEWLTYTWGKMKTHPLAELACITVLQQSWELCPGYRDGNLTEEDEANLSHLLEHWCGKSFPSSDMTRASSHVELPNPDAELHKLWGEQHSGYTYLMEVNLQIRCTNCIIKWTTQERFTEFDLEWETMKGPTKGTLLTADFCPSMVGKMCTTAAKQLSDRCERMLVAKEWDQDSQTVKEARGKLYAELWDISSASDIWGCFLRDKMSLENDGHRRAFLQSLQRLRLRAYPWEGGYTLAEKREVLGADSGLEKKEALEVTLKMMDKGKASDDCRRMLRMLFQKQLHAAS